MSYFLLPLAAFVVNAFTWVYAYARHDRSPLSRAFQLVAGSFTLWCFVDMITWSPGWADYLPVSVKLHGVFWLINGFIIVNFTYTFLQRRRDTIYYLLLVAAAVAVPLHLATDWFYSGFEPGPWGYRKILGPLGVPLILAQMVLPSGYGALLGLQRYLATGDEVVRRQLRQLLFGGLVALVVGVGNDVVAHHLLALHALPQIGVTLTAVFSFFIYRAVAQSDLLAVSLDEAALQLFDSAEDGILVLDGGGRVSLINPSARRLLRVGDEDVSQKIPYLDRLGGGDPEGAEIVLHRDSPHERTLSVSQSTIDKTTLERGRLIIMRDITERQQAEQAVRRSEERYRRLFNSGNDAIFVFRLTSKGVPSHVVEVNDVACRWFGYTKEEIYALKPQDLVPLDRLGDDPRASLEAFLQRGELQIELEARTKQGDWIPAEVLALRFELAGQPAVLAAVRDVSVRRAAATQKRRIQEQLRLTQKMEAVGTLAGGMAHDMNNVLGTIMSLASILMVESDPDDPHLQDIEEVLAACKRGRELTQSLLAFAHKGPSRRKVLALGRRINDVRELLLRTIPKKISVRTRVDDDLLGVKADPDQISHVLMNVCLNAVEALQGEGELIVEASNVNLEDDELSGYPEARPGRYVRLRVSDTGSGMDAETKRRAFEPFFSTKSKGEGTGLGLAMVYSTIAEHGGFVSLESEPGQGTALTIHLPAAGRESRPIPVLTSMGAAEAAMATQGAVLLVDDEEMIRGSTQRLLEALGYEVLLAASGDEALVLYQQRREGVVLVLLDVMMPGLDGEETLHKLQALDPTVPVLLSSGHAVQDQVARMLAAGALGFLPKPYTIDVLADEVNQALERAEAR